MADGQAELVGLAVEGEVPDLARPSTLHLLLHPGVGDHEVAVVEDVMAHQPVEEVGEFLAERGPRLAGQGVDLGQRVGEAVGDLDVLAREPPDELQVVVAGDAQRRAVEHHVPHESNRVEDAGATVHEVSEEDRPAALGVGVDS